MIKLVASDIDGTLLPEGTPAINPELIRYIKKLTENGIHFVVASGRQYDSILTVFEPLRKDVMFICDNGSYIMADDKLLVCRDFPADVWRRLVDYAESIPGANVMVSSVEGTFLRKHDEDFFKLLSEGYGLNIRQDSELHERDIHVTKVAVYVKDGSPLDIVDQCSEQFKGIADAVVSGSNWMDFMMPGTDKGAALMDIQDHKNVKREETAAFGDNYNDMGLLRAAGESYAVSGAKPEVKLIAKYVMSDGADNNGVLRQLMELFPNIR